MARLLVLSLLLASVSADAVLRGAHRDPSLYDKYFGKDGTMKDDSSENVADPMDAYIKSSSGASPEGSVWLKEIASKREEASGKTEKTDTDSLFAHATEAEEKGASTFKPSAEEESIFKPSKFSANMFESAKEEAPIAMPRHSASQSDSSSGQGLVVDIKLDSELQESQQDSFLQGAHKGHTGHRAKSVTSSAPNVEADVANQRLQDVYIHDTFSDQAAEDVKKEQEVKADHDLKA